jgi:hypothetical protein
VAEEPSLSPGVAWHLDAQGQWQPENLPPDVLSKAKFSGYLTIDGYRSSVFETPEGDQWAQKSTGTPVASSSAVFAPRSPRRTVMGPKQTAEHLRQIASKLDRTSKPNKDLVIKDLRWVLANMDAAPPQEQVALPSSGTGKQMLTKMLEDAKKALESGDEAGFKALLEKLSQHS